MRTDCQRALRALAALIVSITGALAALLAGPAIAHDIPASIVVQAWFHATDGALELIVRVPVKAMRDVDYPLRSGVYLDLARAGPALDEAAQRWLVEAFAVRDGDGAPVKPVIAAVRASLESERVFDDWPRARAHVTGSPLAADTLVPLEQLMLDVLLRYDGVTTSPTLQVRPALERLGLRVTTYLRYQEGAGAPRVWELHADPGWVPVAPGAWTVAARFFSSGLAHVLDGADHLLFVLCLVIPLRRVRPLLVVVTAFTLAHSLTLAAAALGVLPVTPVVAALVEVVIAASIVYMALENIIGGRSLSHRWIAAFVFGLVHGVGFSVALREASQFAGDHLVGALLAFNLGVEAAQVIALAAFLVLLSQVLDRLAPGRIGAIVLCALIAHTGWHWMLERAEPLRQMDLPARALSYLAPRP